ncbi:MAG: sigma-70 family RNA polymerase sigma factor [Acetobacteraceae bacterium]|nr:sigma-70 family RNA polymerase sigma factor [Acetobacteraceae bacterium]
MACLAHRPGLAALTIDPPGGPSPTGAALSECIVAVARAQDRAAFETLFLHFAPRLKTYFLRLGTNRGAAEDMAQETLLVVWRRAALFDPGKAGASTWIFAIARNLRLDVARRERLAGNDIAPAPPPGDHSPSAEEAFISSEREDRLRRALHALHPDQTQLLLLWGFEDKSHGQIERETGIPIGTVKSRLRRALALLRASLEGCRDT